MRTDARCDYCGDEVRPDSPGLLRKISCWAENSKSGRPTKILESVDLGFYAHRICHEMRRRGGATQDKLF